MNIFLICPVRNATSFDVSLLREYLAVQAAVGNNVYYPAHDTDQNDDIGWKICTANREAMQKSDRVDVFWTDHSTGTPFDLGMAFAMGKPIEIINPGAVPAKEGKCFENFIFYWQFKSEEELYETEHN